MVKLLVIVFSIAIGAVIVQKYATRRGGGDPNAPMTAIDNAQRAADAVAAEAARQAVALDRQTQE